PPARPRRAHAGGPAPPAAAQVATSHHSDPHRPAPTRPRRRRHPANPAHTNSSRTDPPTPTPPPRPRPATTPRTPTRPPTPASPASPPAPRPRPRARAPGSSENSEQPRYKRRPPRLPTAQWRTERAAKCDTLIA